MAAIAQPIAPFSVQNQTSCPPALDTTSAGRLQFAFARVKGDVVLVQMLSGSTAMSSSLTAIQLRIWRHEFITIFRFSHCDTIHPAEFHILEPIDESCTRYEEESGTVFLAKELMEHLRKMTDRKDVGQKRRSSHASHLVRWK